MRYLIALSLLIAGCAEVPQPTTAKVCVTEKQDVGASVRIIELGKQGTITEVLGPSAECQNPELPILALAKG
jgi:hypothetical protein